MVKSVTPSSNPPGARSSLRTVPRISTEDSAVTRSIASNDSGETSLTPATHWRYPVPSLRTTKRIFPDERFWYTQPLRRTDSPTCSPSSSMYTQSRVTRGLLFRLLLLVAGVFGDDLFLDLRRELFVVIELHVVGAAVGR